MISKSSQVFVLVALCPIILIHYSRFREWFSKCSEVDRIFDEGATAKNFSDAARLIAMSVLMLGFFKGNMDNLFSMEKIDYNVVVPVFAGDIFVCLLNFTASFYLFFGILQFITVAFIFLMGFLGLFLPVGTLSIKYNIINITVSGDWVNKIKLVVAYILGVMAFLSMTSIVSMFADKISKL